MKKQILIIATLILMLSICSFAQAKDDIYPYLDADIYFRALLVHQENFNPSSGIFGQSMGAESGNFNDEVTENNINQLAESRFRLFLTAQMTEQVKGRFTLEINPEYGHEQGFGDFRVNNGSSGTGEIRVKHFYIEVNHPLAGTLGYRVGRQSFASPQSLIVGDPDAEGIAAWWKNSKAGKFTLEAAAADTSETREIEDIYTHARYDLPSVVPWLDATIYGSGLVIRDLTPGPYNAPPEINRGGGNKIGQLLMGESNYDVASGTHANLYWAGTELKTTFGNFTAQLDAVMSTGSIDRGDPVVYEDADEDFEPETEPYSDIDSVMGYMAALDASYGRSFYRVGLGGAYVSGHDPDPDAETYTGYLDIDAGFTFTRFFFCGGPYGVSAGFPSPSVQGSGLIGGKLYLMTSPTSWLGLNMQVAALAAPHSRPQFATDDSEYESTAQDAGCYYGTELDFWAVISPTARISWLLEFDYFHPGSYFKGTATDDDPGNGFLESPDPAYRVAAGFLFE